MSGPPNWSDMPGPGKRPGRLSGLERFERWTETLQMAGTRTGALDATRRMWRHGVRGLRRTASARRRGALAYLAVIGPGMVAACAGNDAGGIATYASAGAAYGYHLLWSLIPVTIGLGIVQEMC